LVRYVLDNKEYRNIEGLAYRSTGSIVYNENSNNIVLDINTLPWPVRTYTKEAIRKSGLFCIIGSRGCYGNCRFCAINSFTSKFHYKKWRGRNITDVVSELEYGINELNAKYILFCDDNFIEVGKKGEQRIDLFISTIKERNIKCQFAFFCRCNDIIFHKNKLKDLVDIGLSHLFLGVESASQRALDYFNKGITPDVSAEAIKICREFGIMAEIGFIMFEPYSTIDEILNNMLFLKKLNLNSIFRFNTKLSVYYGSDFIDSLRNDRLLIQNGYSISYKYKNEEINIIEKLFSQVYEKFIPIASVFYDAKDCITIMWHRKKLDEISDILEIENKINNELTDRLIEQVNFFNSNRKNWSIKFFEEFLNTNTIWIDKFVKEYFYFVNLYVNMLKD